jgi:NAD(P)-dependent dehydrogenase (short-subunit alcohol dehydrogenase family)
MAVALPPGPNFRLDRRRALVTGAGSGIGLAAAVALADAGAEVTLCGRREAPLRELAEAIAARGGQAEALPLDVTDTSTVARLIAARPPYQVLVNNAGINRPAAATDVTEADYDAVMSLNVRAAYFLSCAVARSLRAVGLPGSIITISSQLGQVGGRRRSVYCASKHAVEGWTKAMAWDLGADGIRVNTIAPTFIVTPMTAPLLEDPSVRAEAVRNIALGRLGLPEDLMGAVVFLASDASSLVTGSALLVDGGWTAT